MISGVIKIGMDQRAEIGGISIDRTEVGLGIQTKLQK